MGKQTKTTAKPLTRVFSLEQEAAIRKIIRSEVQRIEGKAARREERRHNDAIDSISDNYGGYD